MASDYPAITSPADSEARPARSGRALLITGLIAFLLGLAAMGWIATHWRGGLALLGGPPAAAPAAPQPVVAQTVAAANAAITPAIADVLATRVRDLEVRLAQIDVRAQGASGNAGRAEALLVAFAARRALDRGVPLGYLEGQVRDHFGQSEPHAVNVIFEAAAKPVTLEALQTGLTDLGPILSGGGAQGNWWSSLRREMADLVVIRRAGTPSPAPEERLARARQKLAAGQVDAALAEVARMPGQAEASNWMDAARRYVDARQALDAIEAAAVRQPRPQAGDAGDPAPAVVTPVAP